MDHASGKDKQVFEKVFESLYESQVKLFNKEICMWRMLDEEQETLGKPPTVRKLLVKKSA